MKKYEKNTDDRKVLVARISQLTGVDARYTFVPRCAYEIGAFTVEKDGSLMVMEGADESILQTLREEGLIGECIEETHPASAVPATQTATAPSRITQPGLGTEEWGERRLGGSGSACTAPGGAGSVAAGDRHLRGDGRADR